MFPFRDGVLGRPVESTVNRRQKCTAANCGIEKPAVSRGRGSDHGAQSMIREAGCFNDRRPALEILLLNAAEFCWGGACRHEIERRSASLKLIRMDRLDQCPVQFRYHLGWSLSRREYAVPTRAFDGVALLNEGRHIGNVSRT